MGLIRRGAFVGVAVWLVIGRELVKCLRYKHRLDRLRAEAPELLDGALAVRAILAALIEDGYLDGELGVAFALSPNGVMLRLIVDGDGEIVRADPVGRG